MLVIKRDGKQEKFSPRKLTNAVTKAYKACDLLPTKDEMAKLRERVISIGKETITVDEIHNTVETFLNELNPTIAKAYVISRDDHKQVKKFVEGKIGFINKYKKTKNTADATVDDNSNVGGKNIGILNAEIHKEDNINVSRGMIMRKLDELYPDFESRRYVEDLESHILYKNDESSFCGAISPYTYSSKEVINVLYNGRNLLIPLDALWDIVSEEEVLVDPDKVVYQKYPENLFVIDRGNNWTEVTHLTKKLRHRDLVRVKTAFGEDIVVTDNHPMITDENDLNKTIPAENSLGECQYKINDNGGVFVTNGLKEVDMREAPFVSEATEIYCFNQNEHTNCWCKRHVKLDWNLGYFVGFFIGDGNYDNTDRNINFTQNDRDVLLRLNSILFESLGVAGRLYCKKDVYNCYNLLVSSDFLYWLLRNYFKIQDKSYNKTIPFNIYETNEEFAKGILCGLIDSDGTINGSQLSIRLSSRACILQCTYLLRHFGYSVGNTMQSLPFHNNSSYKTNYTIWGINCSVRDDSTYLGDSYKIKKVIKTNNIPKYKIGGTTKIINVQRLNENDSFVKSNEYIYDITTSTHTFASNNLLVHNCCSITMYPFLTDGIRKIGGLSAKPKNLDSYCGMYVNLIFATSAQFAGAVATSEFLLYFDYFSRKEWGDDYYLKADVDITSSHSLRKMTIKGKIHQHFQQVIYSINQPAAARGLQSAFVNFSYFDKPFFEGMFGDFYFPDGTQPIWESLCWLQKDFMTWFNEERTKCMLTFPVESFALVYKDGEFLDKDSAEFVAAEYARGHSFFTYISDTVDSLSSCCFSGDTKITYSIDGKTYSEGIAEAYSKHMKDTVEVLSYNPYTKERKLGKAKFVKASSSNLYKIGFEGSEVIATHDHIFPVNMGEEYKDVSVEYLKIGDKLLADKEGLIDVEIKSIDVIKTDEVSNVYCLQMLDPDSPYFVLSNGLITHNCRLKNKVQTKEFNFTNGNMGVQTGSKSVISLNLSRIIQDWAKTVENPKENLESFGAYIEDILGRVYKYHIAYNELLWDMYDAGLLPVYKSGFISLDKQYLTVGINGLNQAAEFLGIECNINDDYMKFCQFVFGKIKECNTKTNGKYFGHKITLNTECVPAESLAIKNYNWDKADGYWVPTDTNLYASYIYKPNDKSLSVLDKIVLHGENYIGDFLDGGSAAHINIDHHFSEEQYRKLLKFAAENGCQYFTFNCVNSECTDCGYISKEPFDVCPKCGGTHIDYYDRIIGYLTKIKNWSSGRQEEQKTRVYSNQIEEC